MMYMLVLSVLLAGCTSSPPATVDEQAVDFTLMTLHDEALSLSAFEGKRVMLNFWATWCGPCREEMSHMQKAYDQHSDAAIIAVNMTDQDYGKTRVQSFVEEYRLTFPVVLDEAGDVAKLYGVIAVPTTIFIDEQGRITDRVSGPLTTAQIDAYMQ